MEEKIPIDNEEENRKRAEIIMENINIDYGFNKDCWLYDWVGGE